MFMASPVYLRGPCGERCCRYSREHPRPIVIDRFPQHTLKYLSLTVLADPFWGRLPWLLKRRGGKHSKHRKSAGPVVAPVCALGRSF